MQDLVNYKGWSIFSYCTPKSDNAYKVNVIIQDVANKQAASRPLELEPEFTDIEVAIEYAKSKGRGLVDDKISEVPKDFGVDTDINLDASNDR